MKNELDYKKVAEYLIFIDSEKMSFSDRDFKKITLLKSLNLSGHSHCQIMAEYERQKLSKRFNH